jgi:hypothetical protein
MLGLDAAGKTSAFVSDILLRQVEGRALTLCDDSYSLQTQTRSVRNNNPYRFVIFRRMYDPRLTFDKVGFNVETVTYKNVGHFTRTFSFFPIADSHTLL